MRLRPTRPSAALERSRTNSREPNVSATLNIGKAPHDARDFVCAAVFHSGET
jgi:hypothetical protein